MTVPQETTYMGIVAYPRPVYDREAEPFRGVIKHLSSLERNPVSADSSSEEGGNA